MGSSTSRETNGVRDLSVISALSAMFTSCARRLCSLDCAFARLAAVPLVCLIEAAKGAQASTAMLFDRRREVPGPPSRRARSGAPPGSLGGGRLPGTTRQPKK